MDKYAVVTDDGLKKTGSEGKSRCPQCGSELISEDPAICPKCGSKPMESDDGDEEQGG